MDFNMFDSIKELHLKVLIVENLLQTSSLCECLGYESADLEECVRMLHDLYLSRRAASFKAVRDKYKQNKVIVLTFNLFFVLVNSIVAI
jgi:hypothetical protein